jgi:hypothetical protein
LVSKNNDSAAAMRAYGSVITFKGRAEMVKAALMSTSCFRQHESPLVDQIEDPKVRH